MSLPFYLIIEKFGRLKLRLRGYFFSKYINLMGGTCGLNLMMGANVIWKYPPHKGIVFGNNVSIGHFSVIDVPAEGSLSLGNFVKLNLCVLIAAAESVEIGNDVLIAEYVSIRDSDHGIEEHHLIRNQKMNSKKVSIGNDVWIARGSAVLKGSIIEDGAILGANSLVSGKTIARNTINVGSPFRELRER